MATGTCERFIAQPTFNEGDSVPPELAGYRTLSQIGVGARSTINQVVRVTSGQFFALKRVVRRTADDQKFLDQVENEYEVSRGVEHPALRKSFEIERKRKWMKVHEILLLMEYISGTTLEQARPTDLGIVIDIFRKVAVGLGALHQQGFVHADIKPNNIIIHEEHEVKIIDFGQSCPIGHKKERIQGTPDYIAPEQVQKLPLDQRTDVFNLGATLYWTLTNRTFPTEFMQTAKSGGHEIKGPAQAPKDIVPKIPATLSQLAMDCCQQTPEKRPSNMGQFVTRLDAAEQVWRKQAAATETPSPQTGGATPGTGTGPSAE